ncbi:MAG: DUF6514 family protein [Eubacteriales bacterium]
MSTSVKCENQLFASSEINVRNKIDVAYRLYRREVDGIAVYSIEVATCSAGAIERKYADSVTTLTEEAERIFAMLIKGKVTACTLYDILEDIVQGSACYRPIQK